MPRLLISDANILIDMFCGALLDRMFRLPYEFAVPDVLFEEELSATYPFLPGQGLRVLELSPRGVAMAVDLSAKYATSGCSRIDLIALALAMQEDASLLTRDWKLRTVSEAEGREVHGTLWLVGELHSSGLLAKAAARQAYDAMQAQGSRLPWPDVEKQIQAMR